MADRRPPPTTETIVTTNGHAELIPLDFKRRLNRSRGVEHTAAPFAMTALAPPLVTKGQIEEETINSSATRNLVQGHAARVRDDPVEFSKQLTLWASGSGWRSYENYIGKRVMYEGYSEKEIKKLVHSAQVTAQIRKLSEERLEKLHLPADVDRTKKLASLERQLREQTLKIANGLVAKMDSVRFLRFFGGTVNILLARMYEQGIHIDLEEYAHFREVAVQAAAKKQSMLFLPRHVSHIDYCTLSWMCYRLGISLPVIVAGDNLNMVVLGSWLQAVGAMFIRRSFGDDALYPVIVKEYVEQLLEEGTNLECFIEGGRSRTGKLLAPKLGILKYVVDGLQNGRTDDVLICPISLQYDKVIEAETYSNELLGKPKEKETLAGLLSNASLVQLKLGRIDVRFAKPWSLKEFLSEQEELRTKAPPPTDAPLKPVDKRKEQAKLLRTLGYRVLSDINHAAVIMPAALVGTVMLTIRGRGVGKDELMSRVEWLRTAIERRGGKVVDFAGMDLESVVDRALLVLKDLIGQHKDLIEPTFYPSNRFELSFYRNQVIHLFVSEAMLCSAMYTRVKAGGTAPSQRMRRTDLLDELHFISRLLQHEFVYGTEGLEVNAAQTIASLEYDQVITVEGDLIGLSDAERATGRNNFDFFNFLIWPFIETYWLGAVSLFALTPLDSPRNPDQPIPWFAEKEFHKSAQLLGKNAHYQGDISYLEAVNQATLANAFQRIVDLGVIITRRAVVNGKSVSLMSIHPKWAPVRTAPGGDIKAEGRLWDFLAHLGTFRREGKNRRNSATVSTRMFKHCSMIAPPVIEWTAYTGPIEAESEFWKPKL